MEVGTAMQIVTKLMRVHGPHSQFYDNTPADRHLLEKKYVARRVVVGFPPNVPGNYTDSHKPMEPFGSAWGRGVVFDDGGKMRAVVTGADASHAIIKSRVGLPVIKTIYFGFADDTLYLEHASVAANKDFTREMLIEIAGALTERGPLRGIIFRLK